MPYIWKEHVGELDLEVRGDTEEDVFVEGLRALAEVMAEEDEPAPGGGVPATTTQVVAEAPDRARLFVAWLNELATLAELEGLAPEDVESLRLEPQRVSADVRARRTWPPNLVKAVTYHQLAFERHDGGWRARVVLDV